MADSVTETAERLRRIHEGESVEAVYACPYTLEHQTQHYDHPYHRDLRFALGDWLAARHGEPVDEAWLERVGFKWDDDEPYQWINDRQFESIGADGFDLHVWRDGTWAICTADDRIVVRRNGGTRGQLLSLMAALGIAPAADRRSRGAA